MGELEAEELRATRCPVGPRCIKGLYAPGLVGRADEAVVDDEVVECAGGRHGLRVLGRPVAVILLGPHLGLVAEEEEIYGPHPPRHDEVGDQRIEARYMAHDIGHG